MEFILNDFLPEVAPKVFLSAKLEPLLHTRKATSYRKAMVVVGY